MTPEETLEVLRELRKDLTAAQIKLGEAMRAVAELPATPDLTRKCPTCGITTRGPTSLQEHIHTSHGGPIPDAWARAEQLATR